MWIRMDPLRGLPAGGDGRGRLNRSSMGGMDRDGAVRLFYSYAQEDQPLLQELEKHLANLG